MRRAHLNIALVAACFASPVAIVAQNLTGTVLADDTGASMPGATVLAIQRTTSTSQRPAIYKAVVDTNGRYALTVPVGPYQLCVHAAGLYLDPCQWGAAGVVTIASTATVPLRLKKGARFILRTHDTGQQLRQAEAASGSRTTAFLTGKSVKQFPLPLVYENGGIRDYGAVVPMNVPLNVVVGSSSLVLADHAGASLSSQGIPFQITAADFQTVSLLPSFLRFKFPPPEAKFVHVYTTDRR